jgi:ribosomal protein S18 acetylase RimI-like enzyme
MTEFGLAKLDRHDMDEVARLHRAAFDAALPWLVGLHTPEEDRAFFRDHVYADCQVWGARETGVMLGFIAYREGFIDQLYVLPRAQGRGVGSALLAHAQSRVDKLSLWTFQRNERARRFYEARGFVLVKETDGSGNEEKEPDALYMWRRAASVR